MKGFLSSSSSSSSSSRLSSSISSSSSKKRELSVSKEWQCPLCLKTFTTDNQAMNSHISFCMLDVEKVNKDKQSKDKQKCVTTMNCPICNGHFNDVKTLTIHAEKCILINDNENKMKRNKIQVKEKTEMVVDNTDISTNNQLPGLFLIYEFITAEEEHNLLQAIEEDSQRWKKSMFNGDYLVKAWGYITKHAVQGESSKGYVRRNVVENNEPDLPEYFNFIITRVMNTLKYNVHLPQETKKELSDFVITECNCNTYIKSKKHHVTYHFDDRGLSGKALINISLLSAGSMRYKNNDNGDDIIVDLPRRTLQIVSGNSRFSFKHAIFAEDIIDEKRISLTFRSPLLRKEDIDNTAKKITNWFNK